MIYKNISTQDLIVNGFMVEAGKTIDMDLIENPNFELVVEEIKTKEETK